MERLPLQLTFRSAFLLAVAVAVATQTSCSDDGASREAAPAAGRGTPVPQDAQAGDAQTATAMSIMRIAHLAPGVGPIDFCYQRVRKGTFVGPVLGGAPAAPDDAGDVDADDLADDAEAPIVDASTGSDDDAGEAAPPRSASYRTVTNYLVLQAAGPITLAVLPAGATSCANALVTADVTLDPGKLFTVALFGRHADGGVSLEIGAFTDDRSTEPDKLRARVIHAALGTADVPSAGPIAVRAVASKTTVLADRVAPRRAATASQAVMVDGLGYVTAAPVPAPASIAIGPASSDGVDAGFETWQSQGADLGLRGDSLHTAFVLSGATESTFEVLWCADRTTSGDQTTCTLVR
ncbi:MAG: DUF4397 domain-containing protein [Labilithrix sp.]|nr:DUF4397 domain-containing protein [Labilithrix sp.]